MRTVAAVGDLSEQVEPGLVGAGSVHHGRDHIRTVDVVATHVRDAARPGRASRPSRDDAA